ncbi:MAG: hypothetical protein ACSHXW_02160 [Yoonia sp.]
MQNSLFLGGVVCAFFIAAPVASDADTISSDIPNAYFAPVSVIEDHPQCDGLGQTALEFTFNTENLSFEVLGGVRFNQAYVDAGGGSTIETEKCFVIQRNGVERIEVPIRCGEGRTSTSPFERVDLEDLSLSMSGKFLACQSPTSFRIMSSDWTVEVSGQTGLQRYEGEFFEFEDAGCENARIVRAPQATLSYNLAGITGPTTSPFSLYRWNRNDRVVEAAPTHFMIGLTGIPILERNGTESVLRAKTTATFFPDLAGETDCRDGICRLPSWLQPWFGLIQPRTCQ